MPNMLNAAQTAEFNEKGFTYARGLFAPDEVKLLTDAMEQDPAVRDSILDRRDGEGRSTRIALWNRAGDSVYGLAARSQRMVDTSAALLGGRSITTSPSSRPRSRRSAAPGNGTRITATGTTTAASGPTCCRS